MTFKGKRVASKADTVEITCPACSNTWSFDASKEDLTTDKQCEACEHTWTPTLGDYSAAVKRGEALTAAPTKRAAKGAVRKQNTATTPRVAEQPRIDVAETFATRNRETVGSASATDPGALYRERNARVGK
jgi:hypothetical protein